VQLAAPSRGLGEKIRKQPKKWLQSRERFHAKLSGVRREAPMILVALGLLCCTPIGAAKPVAAAVFAGTAAAATGVKRKVVGGCWANCSKGWHCDEQSGLCVEDEERPAEPGMNYELKRHRLCVDRRSAATRAQLSE
jgi:hypothetical protein